MHIYFIWQNDKPNHEECILIDRCMAISRIISAVKIQESAEIIVFIPAYVRLSER